MSQAAIPTSKLAYRPDIDGLRAIAVVSVMAFHLGVLRCSGGFVGVDVFFVISGYLISSIIFNEIAESRFSVARFYERRIRRIFPALFAMLICFSIVATMSFLPWDLIAFGKSMLSASLSVSNFYFWSLSGYFDQRNQNALLHTWSLAVEEQFYIFFPLFLIAVRHMFPRGLRQSVAFLFVVSFGLSAWTAVHSPNDAFYLPYSRAWELLLGTMLALGMFPRPARALSRNLVAFAGLAMVAYAVFVFTSATPFPGFAALVPCVGSAMIVVAGERGSSLVANMLSWRPVVFTGLISYSLYLWHWPVIILTRMGFTCHFSPETQQHFLGQLRPDRMDHLIGFVVPFVLATISWRYIERPFRKGRLRMSGKPLFLAAAGTIALCVAYATTIVAGDGLKGRFSPDALAIASYMDASAVQAREKSMRIGVCFIDEGKRIEDFDRGSCLKEEVGKKNYLLLGDSHAAMVWSAMNETLANTNVMQATVSSCKPFVDQKGNSVCAQLMNSIFNAYLPTHHVDEVLLEARWDLGSAEGLESTLRWAKTNGIPVVVLGSVPEYDGAMARLLAYSVMRHDPDMVRDHEVPTSAAIDDEMEKAAARWNVPYVSFYRAICTGRDCRVYADVSHKIPLLYDTDHLTEAGALVVVRELVSEGKLK